jgi:serine/threonine-protein kinase
MARITLIFGLLIQALVRWVAYTMQGSPFAVETHWTPNAHLLVMACGVAIWLRTRSGRRSVTELAYLDVACIVPPFAFSSLVLWFAAPTVRPNLIHVLGAGYLLVLRGVLVPSTGRRTAIIGAAFSAAMISWTYAYYVLKGQGDVAPPRLFATTTGVWSSMAVVISAVASHTIFGLRARVREATQLGQYLLVRKIGEGGMGVVYEARHALLRRRTALKLLPVANAGDSNVARFEREVQLTSTLTHPNTIAIYDYGRSPDGVFYYAMEYLDGVDLQKLIDRHGAVSPGIAAHILEQICGALAEAHTAGLIHRDVKPANVILCERGGTPAVAKVVDFGLVKHLNPSAADPLQTATDTVLGTPLYMSPEAITAPASVDARSDLYAVGALGYFLVTGHPPFSGKTTVEVCAHHLHSTPIPPSQRAGVDLGALDALLLECLEKDPSRRPESAATVARRLAGARATLNLSADALASWWDRCRSASREAGHSPAGSSAATTVLNVELGVR